MGDIHDRLRWARKRAGYASAADAARALKLPYGTYSGHENSGRGIPRDSIVRYAKKFKVRGDWLLTGEGRPDIDLVQIVGIAGAGPRGEIDFSYGQGELGQAPMPPGGNESTVAVEVRGDSMRGIADDGWMVYYDNRREPPTPNMLGELCVVGIVGGGVLIKTLAPGSKRNLYNLESVAAQTLRDVRVEWAALVTAIIPRAPARRLTKLS
jgi:phage repressor protein C with HTH and peptisase S24 domain